MRASNCRLLYVNLSRAWFVSEPALGSDDGTSSVPMRWPNQHHVATPAAVSDEDPASMTRLQRARYDVSSQEVSRRLAVIQATGAFPYNP